MRWAYGIPHMCVWISVYPSTIRKCFFSNMSWWIFVILEHNDHQVGNNRGHLGSLFKYAQNASSSTWFSRFWWNLGEEILSQWFFRGVQEFLIGGHLGVIWGHCWRSNFKQPLQTIQCVGLGQPSKSVHGDLFIRPVVMGSKVRKVHICFYEGSKFE